MKNGFYQSKERKNIQPSAGEAIVMHFLQKRRVKYKREVCHQSLVNDKTGKPLFFDFFIPGLRLVIEVDGIHHYVAVNGKEDFYNQMYRDKIKNKWCKENNYRMLRLCYDDLKKPFTKLFRAIGECKYNEGDLKRVKKIRVKERKPETIITYIDQIVKKHGVNKKNMSGLKNKNQLKQAELEKRRNEARLAYPADIRIDLLAATSPKMAEM